MSICSTNQPELLNHTCQSWNLEMNDTNKRCFNLETRTPSNTECSLKSKNNVGYDDEGILGTCCDCLAFIFKSRMANRPAYNMKKIALS
jgi:hypothetical protein